MALNTNGKYVEISQIIDGVYRDYGFTEEIDWIDAVEWIGEILDLIGAPKQYLDMITDGNTDLGHPCAIEIANYRGTLPSGMVYVVGAREASTKTPMQYSTHTFHKGLVKTEENLPTLSLNWFGNIAFESPFVSQSNIMKDGADSTLTYTLSDCHIFTNFEEGSVELAYKSFPVDCNGYPMVPDNVKYIKAVKAYIAERVGMKLFLKDKMTENKFRYLCSERDWYVGAATVAGVMPSVDEMETWKSSFVRLIPNVNQHQTEFKYLGNPQQYINHNSR